MSTTKRRQWWFTSLGLMVLAVILVAGAGGIHQLPAWRMDLTEDGLYTLSDGTKRVLTSIEQPISLSFFFSYNSTRELPLWRDYARRVRELLREYELASEGRLRLQVIDPEPFSEEEDLAAGAGLQGAPATIGGDTIYFGLVGERSAGSSISAIEGCPEGEPCTRVHNENKNATADKQIIAFFNPEREAFLEYDISQLIYRLSQPNSMVVGVISDLPVFGGFDFPGRQPGKPWQVVEQLMALAEVRPLDTELSDVGGDVDILLIIHPAGLSDSTLYAIDQFVLRGGKALVFVDPLAEMAVAGGAMGMPAPSGSNLEPLFGAWGVNYEADQVLGDAQWALRLPAGDNSLPLPHLGIVGLREAALDGTDIVTMELETINLSTAGILAPVGDAATQWTPLLMSSDNAMPMARSRFVGLRDHGELLKTFTPTGQRYILAARVRGSIKTAFPQGRPAAESAVEERGEKPSSTLEEGESAASEQLPHVSQSIGDINVIVVADTDMLTDRLWVQVSNFFGQRVAAPWANNGDFVMNAVENLGGSADLISVRSRDEYARPFTVVAELERKAADRFREQEQRLVNKLEELEAGIQQLSQNEQGQVILEFSPVQQAEIKAFEKEKMQIRKELRQVQHRLNKDIESLETRLKLMNIALVPSLLTLGAIGLALVRGRRRKKRVSGRNSVV